MVHLSSADLEKIQNIESKLSRNEWHEASFSAATIIEQILWQIHREILGKLSIEEQERLFSPVKEGYSRQGKKIPAWEKMTLGERLRVFRQAKLFDEYEKIEKKNFSSLKNANWDLIIEIRNRGAHPRENPITPSEAYAIASFLYLIALETTNWQPVEQNNLFQKIGQNRWLQWVIICAMLIAFVLPLSFWLIEKENVRNSHQLLNKYGAEISDTLEKGGDYELAIWAMQGDKSVINREVALYRLYKLQAQKIKTIEPLKAYQFYERALGLPVESDKSSVREWQDDLLEKMTPFDRFQAQYGYMAVLITLIIMSLFTVVFFIRKGSVKP